jgi:RHS repeat-associated protein
LISQRRSGATSYYHFDVLGSTDRLTDGSQSVTDSYIYDPWGSLEASTGSTVNPFRFVGLKGYYFDLDVLEYYLRARIYDPPSGRFLSVDPIDDGGGRSLYGYASGNPVNSTDPTGMQSIFDPPPGGTGGHAFFDPSISPYMPLPPGGSASRSWCISLWSAATGPGRFLTARSECVTLRASAGRPGRTAEPNDR